MTGHVTFSKCLPSKFDIHTEEKMYFAQEGWLIHILDTHLEEPLPTRAKVKTMSRQAHECIIASFIIREL